MVDVSDSTNKKHEMKNNAHMNGVFLYFVYEKTIVIKNK